MTPFDALASTPHSCFSTYGHMQQQILTTCHCVCYLAVLSFPVVDRNDLASCLPCTIAQRLQGGSLYELCFGSSLATTPLSDT